MAPEEEEFDIFSWKTVTAIAVVVILILSLFFGYDVISGTQQPYEYDGATAREGDTVYINFTGRYVDGTVFDTTYRDVAENDYLYPKSRDFREKGIYQSYNFVLGNGAKILDTEMPALDKEIEGMKEGQTRRITLEPEDGFGGVDDSLIETIDLVEKLPLYTSDMNVSEFKLTYRMDPKVGLTFEEKEWGWNASVYFIDPETDAVTVKHQPFIGETVDYNGVWMSEVSDVDGAANDGEGEISVRHKIDEDDVGVLQGSDDDGNFVVSGLDADEGTVTLDYNLEGAGKQLIFEITLEKVENISQPTE